MSWNLRYPAGAVLALLTFAHFTKPDTGTVLLRIEPQFAGQPLLLSQQVYRTANGDSLTFDLLRFYLTQVQLAGKNAAFQEPGSYHLLDTEDTNTLAINIKNVPSGQYQTLYMNVGTDSLTNVSGAMGGDLDPTLGMYWAWNSGYINVKIEGRSPSCPTLHRAFAFHIGGYMPPHQTVRRLALPLGKLQVKPGATAVVRIRLDLDVFFRDIQLRSMNQVMIPSAAAARLADAFQSVFRVQP